jgi:DNA replication protein DnaC
MPVPALIAALASSLMGALAKKVLDHSLDPAISKAKERLRRKFKKGKFEAIDWALKGAREDVLERCKTDDERGQASHLLDTLLACEAGPLLDEFSLQVTNTYLLPAPSGSPSGTLATTYRKVSGPAAVVKDQVPDETTLTHLLQSFFLAFRERLLRERDFGFLRQYFQLIEARRQSTVQHAMLDSLEAIAASLAHPVEDVSAVRRDYHAYLVDDLKYHTIRGIAPYVHGQVVSVPLAKVFLPLQAVEGRPALAEYAEEDLLRQAASEVAQELDWQRRREELEKRYTQLSARQAAQRSLNLADLLKNTRAVLLGDPGTGKTTITRYVTYALAAGDPTHVGRRVQGLSPVLIRLANYGKALEQDHTLHLVEYIEGELTPRPEFGRYLRAAIEAGQTFVGRRSPESPGESGCGRAVSSRPER